MSEKQAVIILFGGSGDLARRKLYPALFGLYKRGELKDHFAVIGTARRPWSDDYYQSIVAESCQAVPGANDENTKAFASHFYYQSHDVTDADHYITLKTLAQKLDAKYQVGGSRLYYMAMSPKFFSVIASHLKSEKLLTDDGFNRLIIEKPFGRDYKSAKQLNDSITATFDERQIYRIDHYLGKEMTQALLALRFANPIFSAVWNKDYIKDIQITLAEAVGVETRAGYYETAGAMRDMVQNHVMQLVAYLIMPQPKALTAEAVHEAKGQAFAALKCDSVEEAGRNFVRAQYAENEINDQKVSGYRQEDGVASDSMTETYVAGRIENTTPELGGVPIFIRTGKRLTRKSTQISITFKPSANALFGDQVPTSDVLTIYIEPSEGYSLTLNGKKLGIGNVLTSEELSYRHEPEAAKQAPEAYERLIQDALAGDQTNFSRWNELSLAWQYVDVIQEAWAKQTKMPTYPAGTMGPKEAFDLLAKDGHEWFWQPKTVKLAD